MKKILAIILILFSTHTIANRWIDSKYKDEMSGIYEIKKYKKSKDNNSTIHIQILGYGEANDNLVWIGDSESIWSLEDYIPVRINLDKIKYWAVGVTQISNTKQFIFRYICKASDAVDFACLEGPDGEQIRKQQLIDKILSSKEIKIEFPNYPTGSRVRTFN